MSSVASLEAHQRYDVVRSVGEECVQESELRSLLAEKDSFRCYDGFEPSGRMHIAQGVYKATCVNRCTRAGGIFIFWVADWFALMNDKVGGELDKIRIVGEYLIEVWKAAGMDMTKVEFLWSSDEITAHAGQYWRTVLDIARRNTIARIKKCCTIMGKTEGTLTAAQILYPLMQCADVFFLRADVCQLGVDQRKVNMLAREYCDLSGRKRKPIVLSHHMLAGLKKGHAKMSKSDPDSAIFMEDTADDVARKIRQAYCPRVAQVVSEVADDGMPVATDDKNPVLDYFRYIVFTAPDTAVTAGGVVYTSYTALEQAFVSEVLSEDALKDALIECINRLLEPVRAHFTHNAHARQLLEAVKSYRKAPSMPSTEQCTNAVPIDTQLATPVVEGAEAAAAAAAHTRAVGSCVTAASGSSHAAVATASSTASQAMTTTAIATPVGSSVDSVSGVSSTSARCPHACMWLPAVTRLPLDTALVLVTAARAFVREHGPDARVTLVLPDWQALACNALTGDEKDLLAVLRYHARLLRAHGLPESTVAVCESELILRDSNRFWVTAINAGRANALSRVEAVYDADLQNAGQVIAALMRVSDAVVLQATHVITLPREEHLHALVSDFTHGAVTCVSTASLLLPPLHRPDCAPVVPNADDVLLIDDTDMDVRRKIKRAYCAPHEAHNAIVHVAVYLLHRYGSLRVRRAAAPANDDSAHCTAEAVASNNDTTYSSADALRADCVSGALHPGDLKAAVAAQLLELTSDARALLADAEVKKLAQTVRNVAKKLSSRK